MARRNDVSEVVEIPAKKKKGRLKKVILWFFIILILIVLALGAAVMLYMHSLGITFITGNENGEDTSDDSSLYEDLVESDKTEYEDIVASLRDDSDMSTQLYNWYSNGGDHMSSNNVLNILIVGIDASGNESMVGNSDVMMLASVNKETKSITLCSFLRDSYTYFESSNGNGYYSKLNAAYAYGGMTCLVNAIENNYKIDVDYFVAVDFEAFEAVVDAIGGINVDVEQYEAEAMEDYGNITGVPYGENVTLNGEQALLYCRMRKIYTTGDVQRTENQRKVINAIIKKTQTLSITDLNNVAQTLGEYVYTDCSTAKIVTLGTNALLGKWYNYQVYSMVSPPESAREAYNGNTWMWIVNYPVSAQYVQKQLYGDTNIVLQ
ncbi:MAG: LCP family protein [Clostridiales bacterium]|nr:LCP family protein [Clostridiales bacterium]